MEDLYSAVKSQLTKFSSSKYSCDCFYFEGITNKQRPRFLNISLIVLLIQLYQSARVLQSLRKWQKSNNNNIKSGDIFERENIYEDSALLWYRHQDFVQKTVNIMILSYDPEKASALPDWQKRRGGKTERYRHRVAHTGKIDSRLDSHLGGRHIYSWTDK